MPFVIIQVEHLGGSVQVESSKPISVSEVLEKMGVPPSTVLAVHGDTIIPHTSLIKGNTTLELVVVSSGG
jgi:sulfur carrier protein ThiS